MKLQSTIHHNFSVFAKPGSKPSTPAYLLVPGGATLEVDDAVWLDGFASAFATQINSGAIKILVPPASNLTTAELRKRLHEEAGIKASPDFSKEKLTQIANSLGVSTVK